MVGRGELFSQHQGSERSIFRDESVLYPEYLPEILPHREGQIGFLAECIRPVTAGARPTNVFLHGPPGIGKTAVAGYVLRELKENTSVIGVYINCWHYNSRHAVLSQLALLFGSFAQRKGVATDEVYDKFSEGWKKSTRGAVVILDEADKLLVREGGPMTIYDLARREGQAQMGLVLISNDEYALRRLDARTMSSLNCRDIGFLPYNFEELRSIFQERVKYAFVPGTVEPGVTAMVARFVTNNGGDVRLGLECLLRGGQAADLKGDSFETSILPGVFLNVRKSVAGKLLKGLGEEQKKIVAELAKSGEGMRTGDLLHSYAKNGGAAAPRTFRKHIGELEALGLISTEATGKGVRGKSRVIRLKENFVTGTLKENG